MRRTRSLFATFVVVGAIAIPAAASAEDTRRYESMVVQNRTYSANHEVALSFGLLPLDAFTKGVTASGSYTLHFSDFFAWEVVHAFKSFHYGTRLRDDLEALALQPTPFEVVIYFLTTNAVFKPLYWKGAWMNDSLLYGELLMSFGGGYGWFTRSRRAVVDAGLGFRFFLGRRIWLRMDIRHHVFFNDSILQELDLHHEVWSGIGASVAF